MIKSERKYAKFVQESTLYSVQQLDRWGRTKSIEVLAKNAAHVLDNLYPEHMRRTAEYSGKSDMAKAELRTAMNIVSVLIRPFNSNSGSIPGHLAIPFSLVVGVVWVITHLAALQFAAQFMGGR